MHFEQPPLELLVLGFDLASPAMRGSNYNPQYITMALCIGNGGILVYSMFHVDGLHLAGHKIL